MTEWSNKWFPCRSCGRNSDLFCDPMFMEVLELNAIVLFIVVSVCKQFCSCFCAFNFRIRCQLIHWLFNKGFGQQTQWISDILLSLIYKNPWPRYLCQFRLSKLVQASRTRLIRWFNGGSDDTALLLLLLLKIKSVRMQDTIVCSEPLVWLFSLAWDAVILTLDVGFICPFVGIDPTDKVAATLVAPGRMIDNFLLIPDAESLHLYLMVLKLACVWYHIKYDKIIHCIWIWCHEKEYHTWYRIWYPIQSDIIKINIIYDIMYKITNDIIIFHII